MKQLLQNIRKENFVNFGEYSLSPLMELSVGLQLEYANKLKDGRIQEFPLVLSFPNKKSASIWSSLSLLSNFFFEEYIENAVNGPKLSNGDVISINGAICRLKHISEKRITLQFKDQEYDAISDDNFDVFELVRKMSKVNSGRSLNKKSKYDSGKRNRKNKRNAISKILIPNDSDVINEKNLNAKVLLISGRGNVGYFHDFLAGFELYEEPLSKIYGVDNNLIIRADLKPFVSFFKSDKASEAIGFKEILSKLISFDLASNVKEDVLRLIELLDRNGSITKDFDDEFTAFIDAHGEELPKLEFVCKKYPGIQEGLPDNLKAVILNDINQLEEYANTISGFLKLKIPVIVVSNRLISTTAELNFYNDLFNKNPEFYRINWNRKKIKALIQCATQQKYLDDHLWDYAKKYTRQKINIQICQETKLDTLSVDLQRVVAKLEEYEVLQKAYYQFLYPAIYSLKNSNRKTTKVDELLEHFIPVFESCKDSGVPKEAIDLFSESIEAIQQFGDNTKEYQLDSNIYAEPVQVNADLRISIPNDIHTKNIPSVENTSILFSGFPYREHSGKHLSNCVFNYYTKYVRVLCWPKEGILTYGYLRRRATAGYFDDNVREIIELPSDLLIKGVDDINDEIDSFLKTTSLLTMDNEQESDLESLHKVRYKGYGSSHHPNSFQVKCNVLNFEDGSFMFLPKDSKVLASTETRAGFVKVKNLMFNELSQGSKVFKYRKDRSLFKELSKHSKKVYNAYKELESWREGLNKVSNSCGEDIHKIEQKLMSLRDTLDLSHANPSIQNIRNWLHDEDMIMPDIVNVQLILSASGVDSAELKEQLNSLQDSYTIVKSDRIHIAHEIKKVITDQAVKLDQISDGEFEVKLNGVPFHVDIKTVQGLDDIVVEVDYQNTRRILC